MLLPRKYGHVLFSALLSAFMVSIVSATVLLINQGYQAGFFATWLKTFASTWPIAFPAVLIIAPTVRRIVHALTYETEK